MKNAPITFHPSIYRLYFGLAGMLATFHVFRSTAERGWDAKVAFIAGASDVGVILLLSTIYFIAEKATTNRKIARVVNKNLHLLLCSLIALLATASQMLFIATGESLNANIILFGLNHAQDLALVVSSGVGSNTLTSILTGWVLLGLALTHFNKATLNATRISALLFPFVTLSACTLLEGDSEKVVNADLAKNSSRDSSLYQGVYEDFIFRQTQWNSYDGTYWKQGIVAGFIFNATHGVTEYQTLSLRAERQHIYQTPQYASHEGPLPNIVLILLESVRHSELGAYGESSSGISKTPFIDSLAKEGLVYERAYTTIPHTSKALVGIYCGTFPSFDANISESQQAPFSYSCLPHILGKASYRSAHFQTAPSDFESRGDFLRAVGFDHFMTQESFANEPWQRLGYLGLDDRAFIRPAVNWMKQQRAEHRPFFASLLTIATHHPYSSPGSIAPISDTQNAYAQYVAGVRYTDVVVAELFEQLKKEGLTDNTIFIITGDHGEGFAEHGQIAHNGTAYEEGMRVPLIIYAPTLLQRKGSVAGLRQHIDIMPTLFEMAGIRYSGLLPGRSLLSDPHGHQQLIASCFYTNYCLDFYTDDGLKSIYFYGNRPMELYDLLADPGERKNLAGAHNRQLMDKRLSHAAGLRSSYELACSEGCNPLLASKQ